MHVMRESNDVDDDEAFIGKATGRLEPIPVR